MIDEIIFDYDNAHLSGRKALTDGIRLIIYSICKYLRIKHKCIEKIYEMTDNYAVAIVELNKLLKIKTIIGIKDTINKEELIEKLKLIDESIDVRKHIHIGANDDENKIRLWIPPLNQSKLSYNFEKEYMNNKIPYLLKGDRPIFHFDYPHNIFIYINFLYLREINYKGDYEIIDTLF